MGGGGRLADVLRTLAVCWTLAVEGDVNDGRQREETDMAAAWISLRS